MTTTEQNARQLYEKLSEKYTEISSLSGISSLLMWDQNVYMPKGGSDARGTQSKTLSGIMHDLKTSEALGSIISALEKKITDANDLTDMEKAAVRDARRNFDNETKIPRDMAVTLAQLSVEGFEAWAKARGESNFSIFQPVLSKWVEISRQKAKLLDSSKPAYEVLMDEHERGMTVEILNRVFGEIKKELPPFLEAIKNKPKPNQDFLQHEFDTATQAKFSHRISEELGFDLDKGRLDVSPHPFTVTIAPGTDVRITTRYKPNDVIEGLTGTIHETGHALYEQALPKEFAHMPVGSALSMGMHESQSLFWERMVGLSEPFWRHYWPVLQQTFPHIPKEATYQDFYKAINTVTPGFIRVESDEVTYPLHIIVRYEIEEALINGSLQVDENLPRIWNEKMQQYLGITPKTDKEGILQDIHWSGGAFGYFPTYTLGAIYASQFYYTAKQKIPDLEQQIGEGKFAQLKEWLNVNIHSKASLIPSGDQLCRQITGKGLDPSFFIQHLKQKYTAIYGL